MEEHTSEEYSHLLFEGCDSRATTSISAWDVLCGSGQHMDEYEGEDEYLEDNAADPQDSSQDREDTPPSDCTTFENKNTNWIKALILIGDRISRALYVGFKRAKNKKVAYVRCGNTIGAQSLFSTLNAYPNAKRCLIEWKTYNVHDQEAELLDSLHKLETKIPATYKEVLVVPRLDQEDDIDQAAFSSYSATLDGILKTHSSRFKLASANIWQSVVIKTDEAVSFENCLLLASYYTEEHWKGYHTTIVAALENFRKKIDLRDEERIASHDNERSSDDVPMEFETIEKDNVESDDYVQRSGAIDESHPSKDERHYFGKSIVLVGDRFTRALYFGLIRLATGEVAHIRSGDAVHLRSLYYEMDLYPDANRCLIEWKNFCPYDKEMELLNCLREFEAKIPLKYTHVLVVPRFEHTCEVDWTAFNSYCNCLSLILKTHSTRFTLASELICKLSADVKSDLELPMETCILFACSFTKKYWMRYHKTAELQLEKIRRREGKVAGLEDSLNHGKSSIDGRSLADDNNSLMKTLILHGNRYCRILSVGFCKAKILRVGFVSANPQNNGNLSTRLNQYPNASRCLIEWKAFSFCPDGQEAEHMDFLKEKENEIPLQYEEVLVVPRIEKNNEIDRVEFIEYCDTLEGFLNDHSSRFKLVSRNTCMDSTEVKSDKSLPQEICLLLAENFVKEHGEELQHDLNNFDSAFHSVKSRQYPLVYEWIANRPTMQLCHYDRRGSQITQDLKNPGKSSVDGRNSADNNLSLMKTLILHGNRYCRILSVGFCKAKILRVGFVSANPHNNGNLSTRLNQYPNASRCLVEWKNFCPDEREAEHMAFLKKKEDEIPLQYEEVLVVPRIEKNNEIDRVEFIEYCDTLEGFLNDHSSRFKLVSRNTCMDSTEVKSDKSLPQEICLLLAENFVKEHGEELQHDLNNFDSAFHSVKSRPYPLAYEWIGNRPTLQGCRYDRRGNKITPDPKIRDVNEIDERKIPEDKELERLTKSLILFGNRYARILFAGLQKVKFQGVVFIAANEKNIPILSTRLDQYPNAIRCLIEWKKFCPDDQEADHINFLKEMEEKIPPQYTEILIVPRIEQQNEFNGPAFIGYCDKLDKILKDHSKRFKFASKNICKDAVAINSDDSLPKLPVEACLLFAENFMLEHGKEAERNLNAFDIAFSPLKQRHPQNYKWIGNRPMVPNCSYKQGQNKESTGLKDHQSDEANEIDRLTKTLILFGNRYTRILSVGLVKVKSQEVAFIAANEKNIPILSTRLDQYPNAIRCLIEWKSFCADDKEADHINFLKDMEEKIPPQYKEILVVPRIQQENDSDDPTITEYCKRLEEILNRNSTRFKVASLNICLDAAEINIDTPLPIEACLLFTERFIKEHGKELQRILCNFGITDQFRLSKPRKRKYDELRKSGSRAEIVEEMFKRVRKNVSQDDEGHRVLPKINSKRTLLLVGDQFCRILFIGLRRNFQVQKIEIGFPDTSSYSQLNDYPNATKCLIEWKNFSDSDQEAELLNTLKEMEANIPPQYTVVLVVPRIEEEVQVDRVEYASYCERLRAVLNTSSRFKLVTTENCMKVTEIKSAEQVPTETCVQWAFNFTKVHFSEFHNIVIRAMEKNKKENLEQPGISKIAAASMIENAKNCGHIAKTKETCQDTAGPSVSVRRYLEKTILLIGDQFCRIFFVGLNFKAKEMVRIEIDSSDTSSYSQLNEYPNATKCLIEWKNFSDSDQKAELVNTLKEMEANIPPQYTEVLVVPRIDEEVQVDRTEYAAYCERLRAVLNTSSRFKLVTTEICMEIPEIEFAVQVPSETCMQLAFNFTKVHFTQYHEISLAIERKRKESLEQPGVSEHSASTEKMSQDQSEPPEPSRKNLTRKIVFVGDHYCRILWIGLRRLREIQEIVPESHSGVSLLFSQLQQCPNATKCLIEWKKFCADDHEAELIHLLEEWEAKIPPQYTEVLVVPRVDREEKLDCANYIAYCERLRGVLHANSKRFMLVSAKLCMEAVEINSASEFPVETCILFAYNFTKEHFTQYHEFVSGELEGRRQHRLQQSLPPIANFPPPTQPMIAYTPEINFPYMNPPQGISQHWLADDEEETCVTYDLTKTLICVGDRYSRALTAGLKKGNVLEVGFFRSPETTHYASLYSKLEKFPAATRCVIEWKNFSALDQEAELLNSLYKLQAKIPPNYTEVIVVPRIEPSEQGFDFSAFSSYCCRLDKILSTHSTRFKLAPSSMCKQAAEIKSDISLPSENCLLIACHFAKEFWKQFERDVNDALDDLLEDDYRRERTHKITRGRGASRGGIGRGGLPRGRGNQNAKMRGRGRGTGGYRPY